MTEILQVVTRRRQDVKYVSYERRDEPYTLKSEQTYPGGGKLIGDWWDDVKTDPTIERCLQDGTPSDKASKFNILEILEAHGPLPAARGYGWRTDAW